MTDETRPQDRIPVDAEVVDLCRDLIRIDTTNTGDGQGPDAYLARQPYFRTMPRFLLRETGIHFIDTFRFLFGEIAEARIRRQGGLVGGQFRFERVDVDRPAHHAGAPGADRAARHRQVRLSRTASARAAGRTAG